MRIGRITSSSARTPRSIQVQPCSKYFPSHFLPARSSSLLILFALQVFYHKLVCMQEVLNLYTYLTSYFLSHLPSHFPSHYPPSCSSSLLILFALQLYHHRQSIGISFHSSNKIQIGPRLKSKIVSRDVRFIHRSIFRFPSYDVYGNILL